MASTEGVKRSDKEKGSGLNKMMVEEYKRQQMLNDMRMVVWEKVQSGQQG